MSHVSCENKITILGVTVTQMEENWPNILSLLLHTAGREGLKGSRTLMRIFSFKYHKGLFFTRNKSFLYTKPVLFKKSILPMFSSRSFIVSGLTLRSKNIICFFFFLTLQYCIGFATLRKPELKETCVPQCSSQHCL